MAPKTREITPEEYHKFMLMSIHKSAISTDSESSLSTSPSSLGKELSEHSSCSFSGSETCRIPSLLVVDQEPNDDAIKGSIRLWLQGLPEHGCGYETMSDGIETEAESKLEDDDASMSEDFDDTVMFDALGAVKEAAELGALDLDPNDEWLRDAILDSETNDSNSNPNEKSIRTPTSRALDWREVPAISFDYLTDELQHPFVARKDALTLTEGEAEFERALDCIALGNIMSATDAY